MAAAKRSLSSSSSHHPNHQSSAKRPRLVIDDGSQSNGGIWSGFAFFKDSFDWMVGRRECCCAAPRLCETDYVGKPSRPSPQVRRTNGTASAVGLRLGLSGNGGVIAAPNGRTSSEALELSDDDGDISIDFEREEQRRQQATEARRHLNDHARTFGGDTPENIHPLLPQPLFSSSFDSPRSSVESAPTSLAPPTHSKVPNRPDVGYSKPRREYKFARSRSSSSNLSSPSSLPPRSPRRSTCRNYRFGSEKEEAAQFAMLDRIIREKPEQSAPVKRVRDELLREREQHRYAGECTEGGWH